MATPRSIPLFPAYNELKDFDWRDYPQLDQFFNDNPKWCREHWDWAREYLIFLGRNKSEHTYIRFRSDIEKFLLWSFLVAEKPAVDFRKNDLLDYSEFFFKPPQTWIGLANVDKFVPSAGLYEFNKSWRPFRYIAEGSDADKKKYRPSQQSILAMFSAISGFYTHLMESEIALGNPAGLAKKDCKRLVKDAQVKETKRLDQAQWDLLLITAEKMADEDSLFERNIFLLAAMKTMFLRISELAERDDWIPVMSHFWQDDKKNWWLKIYGKGKKIRDISVPDSFLPYLERYRLWRGLPALPGRQDKQPIVEKIRGAGGMSGRQLARLVHQVLDKTYETMRSRSGEKAAQIFKDVSPHWLRHTGASMEIERGRALKDVSEDLGHSSMATTDTVYVQTSAKKRAESGKSREV
ncbi:MULTISPECIES: tyrosine-type recombinase/integrase [unclassified Oleiphilus]|nr:MULTISPECIES: tyrosine-type recombinase/integrase [unclassified Oleiphilus]KZY43164.1 integrase [Oleiphilus sp. HI0050]KZY81442.1 integrase [Oleiphilus sp. HI0069]KZZ06634.1 integrase [Oleiphilus sp. HI0078]KZZ47322.1 integrase [Oleiphilus sp. HI0085]KZY35001.1 integrase [Oleiphilus sp. HI0043]